MRIKDVAREAGVSTATVSHVINKTRRVTDETRERVLRAVERCGYYPNAHARSLASGRSNTLGLIISDISNPFFPELVKSIERAAFERGYDLILSNTNYEAERTSSYVQRLIERKVAGVALMTSELDTTLVGELARQRVCVVFLDLGSAGRCMNNIVVDYDTGIEEAIAHLVALGHREIAFVSGPRHLRSAMKRLDAFRTSLARHLPETAPQVYDGNFKLDGGREAARALLERGGEMPTAIVVANDMMALGVMQEFRECGVEVPRDVSVVGFDDIAFAQLAAPPLTTVSLPREELGRRAVEALIASVEHSEQQGTDIHIATRLVARASTGRAPARNPEGRTADAAANTRRDARTRSLERVGIGEE
ncbi:MAG TPA: LacI family DNA-binding transcriptional regulator [Pyrinomonadaceae bacterium]|nr:LacI family DNA-binding transcriptional regulator [Pyrinomonadaceae bacterium]